ncbi:MAG: 2-amino-4-hydroxy-6-hydroxymethyldihydropteridine diphosphokinase [Rubrivivax sp.]
MNAAVPSLPATAHIGLGANLGDAAATLAQALQALHDWPGVQVQAVSGLYRSAPVDAGGPDFLNAAAALHTTLDAAALLAVLHALEARAGRTRPFVNAPRTLDLDLLDHGGQVVCTPGLTLPHPRLHRRRFVLEPLADIAPDLRVAGQGRVTDLLAAVAEQAVERVAAGDAWRQLARRA